MCQGIDTIVGVWSVARSPQDCRDFQIATSIHNDVFRRTKLSSMASREHREIERLLREGDNATSSTNSATSRNGTSRRSEKERGKTQG